MAEIDVLGVGAVSVDDFVTVDNFPRQNTKVQADAIFRQPGGLSGTALVAVARMGGRAAYAGTLGDDDLSRFVVERLAKENVDVSQVAREADARPFHSIVVVASRQKSRTILYSSEGVVGAHRQLPTERFVRRCGALLLDPVGIDGMVRLAEIASKFGIPRVGDFERGETGQFPRLLELTNHLIMPLEFGQSLTGRADPRAAIEELWSSERDVVVLTHGEEGSWYRTQESDGRVVHERAESVNVVDTTGCGDVFHGVYAFALSKGYAAAERVRMASIAAALKATRLGGQDGIPYLADVKARMGASNAE